MAPIDVQTICITARITLLTSTGADRATACVAIKDIDHMWFRRLPRNTFGYTTDSRVCKFKQLGERFWIDIFKDSFFLDRLLHFVVRHHVFEGLRNVTEDGDVDIVSFSTGSNHEGENAVLEQTSYELVNRLEAKDEE